MSELLYKIMSRSEWYAAVAAGCYPGSSDDRRDGFIHFSNAQQLAGTAEKHFAGRNDLLLLAVDAASLGPSLRHEPSRGGDLFPHLYGELALDSVCWVKALTWQNGSFVWPGELDHGSA